MRVLTHDTCPQPAEPSLVQSTRSLTVIFHPTSSKTVEAGSRSLCAVVDPYVFYGNPEVGRVAENFIQAKVQII